MRVLRLEEQKNFAEAARFAEKSAAVTWYWDSMRRLHYAKATRNYLKFGDYHSVLRVNMSAVSDYPDYDAGYVYVGAALYKLKKYKESDRWFRRLAHDKPALKGKIDGIKRALRR